MKKILSKKGVFLSIALILILSLMFVTGCAGEEPSSNEEDLEESSAVEDSTNEEAEAAGGEIILSTTTSTENSGLLDEILPVFTEETGIEVKVVAVGTGAAIQNGEDGEADVLMVHAKAAEEEFVEAGHGLERFDLMYNDFVILGPEDDPANISENPTDVSGALAAIVEEEATFISRGDDSGTHKKELELWENADIEPSGDWYVEAGDGMGATLQMAEEMLGYTMSDRATYLSMSDELEVQVLVEGNEVLFNQYGVIAVDPDKNDMINAEGAQAFIDWILSNEVQELIGEFGVEEYGQALFTPNAQ